MEWNRIEAGVSSGITTDRNRRKPASQGLDGSHIVPRVPHNRIRRPFPWMVRLTRTFLPLFMIRTRSQKGLSRREIVSMGTSKLIYLGGYSGIHDIMRSRDVTYKADPLDRPCLGRQIASNLTFGCRSSILGIFGISFSVFRLLKICLLAPCEYSDADRDPSPLHLTIPLEADARRLFYYGMTLIWRIWRCSETSALISLSPDFVADIRGQTWRISAPGSSREG